MPTYNSYLPAPTLYRKRPSSARPGSAYNGQGSTADDIRSIGDTIVQAMQQRRQNGIADRISQELAVQGAKPATPVLDDDGDPITPEDDTPLSPERRSAINQTLGFAGEARTSIGTGGEDELTVRMMQRKLQAEDTKRQGDDLTQQMNQQMKRAQIAKLLQAGSGGDAGLTAYQRQALALQQRRLDLDAGKQARLANTPSRVDPSAAFNTWLKTNTGLGLADIPKISGQKLLNDAGEGDTNGGTFAFDLDGKTKKLPAPVANEAMRRYNSYLAGVGGGAAPQGGNASTPPPALPPGQQPVAGGDPLSRARAAISAGADPEKVKARLSAAGIDPSQL